MPVGASPALRSSPRNLVIRNFVIPEARPSEVKVGLSGIHSVILPDKALRRRPLVSTAMDVMLMPGAAVQTIGRAVDRAERG